MSRAQAPRSWHPERRTEQAVIRLTARERLAINLRAVRDGVSETDVFRAALALYLQNDKDPDR